MAKAFRGMFFVVLFTAVSIILSLFFGLVWRDSLVILALSLVASFILFKKIRFDCAIPWRVYLISGLILVLVAHPLLTIHPFIDASADPAPVTAALVIGETIPLTYSPYSDLRYTYQPGLPLFAKIFIDLLPVEPYLIFWVIAILFSAFQPVFLFSFASKLLKSERAGIWVAVLFVGTKLVFQNVYVGEYTWSVATVFFFAAALLFLEKNRLQYLIFPAIFITHQGVGFYALLFFVIYLFFFREKNVLKIFPSLILAIPAFFITYLPAIGNVHSGLLPASSLIRFYSTLPLFVGIVPVLFLAGSFGYLILKRRHFERGEKFIFCVLVASVALYGIFNLGVSPVMGVKIVEMITICVLLLAGAFLSRIQTHRWLFVTAILLSLAFFFTSSTLTEMRLGSKITPAEAEFSFHFRDFDPGLKKTIFISPAGAKMAEYAHKIPFNVRGNWFISSADHLSVKDEAYRRVLEKERIWNDIVKKKCVACLNGLEVEYIVVNRGTFPELERQKVFEDGQFIVYWGDGHGL